MIDVRVDGAAAGIVLKKISDAIPPTLAKTVLKAANYAGGVIAKKVVELFPDGKGQLARSFLPAKFVATGGFGTIAAGALSTVVHADIQDKGGVIKPVTAKLLAIPQTPKAEKRWPRDWAKGALFFAKSAKGTALLFERGRRGRAVLQYVLKPQVTIVGRHYIDKSAEEAAAEIERITGDDVQRGVDGAGGGNA